LYILPGLIDAHVHIESSLLTPCFFCSNRATLWNYYGCSRSS
jgi:adenine deaminase